MPQPIMISGLFIIAFLLLWFTTRGISNRSRLRQSSEMERKVTELRHVVTEMAMEKHDSRKSGRH